MSKQQVEDLGNYEGSDAYSDLQRTVITFAVQFTQDARVKPEIMTRLTESLGPDNLVKLSAAVAQAIWTNGFNNSFAVELP